ncbi:hypothetical protein KGO5_01748 [Sinorhizobium sp. KGO-5]|uniref:hypothetical protein n=1 Tax=Sinorhizobium sp. KGO-5 TaxID=1470810 RepID=UPI002949D669|nr:hypothetical protein KGO5_01748 [Sinorhizobium sp. KGO-5]
MIDLIEPSALPKDSLSEGPESWGEAWTRLVAEDADAGRIIENLNSDQVLMSEIYADRIDRIESLTGTRLPNPVEIAPLARRPRFNLGRSMAATVPEIDPTSTIEEFDRRTAELAGRFPQIESIVGETIEAEMGRRRRESQAEAARAAEAPELGALGRFTAHLAGGLAGAARDPNQWQMAAYGGISTAGKTVAGRIGQTMMTEFLLNGGQEAVLQIASQERKRAAGLDHGLQDILANVGIAGTFGALFGGAVQGGAELARILNLGEGGAERAARVIEGRPEPGDVEAVAKAMNIELTPERLDLLNRSFEERVLDDVMMPADADPGQMRVFEAAQRYADDPDNNPPPELVERLVADEEAVRTRFSPDAYERMFAGDQNAIDDIADTFMVDTIDDAATRIDAVADRVDAIAEEVEQLTMSGGRRAEGGGDIAIEERWPVEDRQSVRAEQQEFLRSATLEEGSSAANGKNVMGIAVNSPELEAAFMAGVDDALTGAKPRTLPNRQQQILYETGTARATAAMADGGLSPGPLQVAKPARLDPLQGQTIRPSETPEPLDDAAERIADVQAGDIVEPARDANGNPENFLDFVGVEDGDGNVKIMSTAEALAMADEPEFFADLLEACKL